MSIKDHSAQSEQNYLTLLLNSSLVGQYCQLRRSSKRHALNQKKLRKAEFEEEKIDHLESDSPLAKTLDDDSPSQADLKSKNKKNIGKCSIEGVLPFQIEKIISKPQYIFFNAPNRIVGNFGHGSVIFRRPIIEGSFFIQFIVREDTKKDRKTKEKSSVRVGICKHDYKFSLPLGGKGSVAYKTNGCIIRDNRIIGRGDPYQIGDVLAVCVDIASPKKHFDPEKDNEGSSVTFYKNGKIQYSENKLKQMYYCFGVSLFNYSQVDVPLKTNLTNFLPEQAKHYEQAINQKIPYPDLEEKKLFKV